MVGALEEDLEAAEALETAVRDMEAKAVPLLEL